jgi:hypothetical protein
MKYWEIIADNLSKAGWSWGCISAVDSSGRTIFVADAHRGGQRFVVRADEKLTAFVGALKLGVAESLVIFLRRRSASFVCVDAIKNRGDICAQRAHHLLNPCDSCRSGIAPAEFLGKCIPDADLSFVEP